MYVVSGFSRTGYAFGLNALGLALLPRESEAPGPDARCEAAADRATRGHLLRRSSSLDALGLLARSGASVGRLRTASRRSNPNPIARPAARF